MTVNFFFRMERDDRFKFKLSVPQWVNDGQVSGVPLTPQKINCGDFMDTFKHVSLTSW